MKITLLDDYQNVVASLDCFKQLTGYDVTVLNEGLTESALEKIKETEVLILIRERAQITEALLKSLPKLKLISQTGKISNHLDLALCSKYNVAVAEGIGSPIAPAELCWALVMASSRHLVSYAENMKKDVWQHSGSLGLGRTLNGLNFGIWGFGKIGQKIARYANAFDMKVTVWGSEKSRKLAEAQGYHAAESKDAFFNNADIISLHLRLNDSTRHIVSASDLQKMKPNALLVNTSRAELVEENALYESLLSGCPGFAAVDVFETEPASSQTTQLLSLPNVLATPHIGYVEKNSYETYFNAAFENVIKFAHGAPVNIANPEIL